MEYLTPINLEIGITPIACPRPRATKYGHMFMPKKYKDWIGIFGALAKSQYKGKPIFDCAVDITFVHRRPKSKRGKLNQYIPKCTKPDLDNCIKAVLDGLVSCGVLEDDRFIYKIGAQQFYGKDKENPSITISLSQIKTRKKR